MEPDIAYLHFSDALMSKAASYGGWNGVSSNGVCHKVFSTSDTKSYCGVSASNLVHSAYRRSKKLCIQCFYAKTSSTYKSKNQKKKKTLGQYVNVYKSADQQLHIVNLDRLQAYCQTSLKLEQVKVANPPIEHICTQCIHGYRKPKTSSKSSKSAKASKSSKSKQRIRVPHGLRLSIWKRDMGSLSIGQGPCYVCKTPIEMATFELGHVVAKANGGTLSPSNLKCICHTCNRGMETLNMETYKKCLGVIENRAVSARPVCSTHEQKINITPQTLTAETSSPQLSSLDALTPTNFHPAQLLSGVNLLPFFNLKDVVISFLLSFWMFLLVVHFI